MPIYEYRCIQCGERFEVLQSIGEDGSGLGCPKCHAGNPKRLFSSCFIHGSSDGKTSGISSSSCSSCSSHMCSTCGL